MESSYAEEIVGAGHWDLCVLVVVISDEVKEVSSTEAMMRDSPEMQRRLSLVPGRI